MYNKTKPVKTMMVNPYFQSQTKLLMVFCLDTMKEHYIDAKTPYEAMDKMKSYLDISGRDNKTVIHKTESNTHLYMQHKNKTYIIKI